MNIVFYSETEYHFILQGPGPDSGQPITRYLTYLEPLVIAANITQAAFCRMDEVLLTFGSLFVQYHKMGDDKDVQDAILSSLKKCWANIWRQTRKFSLLLSSWILCSVPLLFDSWTFSIEVEFVPYLLAYGNASIPHLRPLLNFPWPNMQKKAHAYVTKRNRCQRFAPNIHQPGGILNPLSSPWLFGGAWILLGPFLR